MADHTRRSQTDEDPVIGHGGGSSSGTPWGTYALVLVAVVVLLAFVVLHVSGAVGPAAH